MNTMTVRLDVKPLLLMGVVMMLLGLLLLSSGGEVALGIACIAVIVGMGVDLLIGLPAICALSYVGGFDISGFVLLGFGFSRLLMSLCAVYMEDKS